MSDSFNRDLQIEELLIDEALVGLNENQKQELEDLGIDIQFLSEFDEIVFEVASSNLHLETIPSNLRDQILKTAPTHLDPRSSIKIARPESFDQPLLENKRKDSRASLSWIMTTCFLMIALISWLPSRESVKPALNLGDARVLLIEQSNTIVAEWAPGPDSAGKNVKGDIVWNNDQQQGYMRFDGLAINDPQTSQYQLWIFDTQQDEKTPIDGGVFDISDQGECIIPIDAKLAVSEAYLFAITIEKPGGVVVSSRERLPLIAQVPNDAG